MTQRLHRTAASHFAVKAWDNIGEFDSLDDWATAPPGYYTTSESESFYSGPFNTEAEAEEYINSEGNIGWGDLRDAHVVHKAASKIGSKIASKTAGVEVDQWWDFKPGQRVMTSDGFPGKVSFIEDGVYAGMEQYYVTLDDGMGEGTYAPGELTAYEATVAQAGHLASEDYPELADILYERLPLPHAVHAVRQFHGMKVTASDPVEEVNKLLPDFPTIDLGDTPEEDLEALHQRLLQERINDIDFNGSPNDVYASVTAGTKEDIFWKQYDQITEALRPYVTQIDGADFIGPGAPADLVELKRQMDAQVPFMGGTYASKTAEDRTTPDFAVESDGTVLYKGTRVGQVMNVPGAFTQSEVAAAIVDIGNAMADAEVRGQHSQIAAGMSALKRLPGVQWDADSVYASRKEAMFEVCQWCGLPGFRRMVDGPVMGASYHDHCVEDATVAAASGQYVKPVFGMPGFGGGTVGALDEYGDELECLDDHGENTCSGPVEYHSIDPGRTRAFPRCQKHWGERLNSRDNSIERYENSDVAPGWFDPSYAGERWDDDY